MITANCLDMIIVKSKVDSCFCQWSSNGDSQGDDDDDVLLVQWFPITFCLAPQKIFRAMTPTHPLTRDFGLVSLRSIYNLSIFSNTMVAAVTSSASTGPPHRTHITEKYCISPASHELC